MPSSRTLERQRALPVDTGPTNGAALVHDWFFKQKEAQKSVIRGVARHGRFDDAAEANFDVLKDGTTSHADPGRT